MGRASFRGIKVKGDKLTRALPWANRAEAEKVVLVRGGWTEAFSHRYSVLGRDDQIDAVNLAVNMMEFRKREVYAFLNSRERSEKVLDEKIEFRYSSAQFTFRLCGEFAQHLDLFIKTEVEQLQQKNTVFGELFFIGILFIAILLSGSCQGPNPSLNSADTEPQTPEASDLEPPVDVTEALATPPRSECDGVLIPQTVQDHRNTSLHLHLIKITSRDTYEQSKKAIGAFYQDLFAGNFDTFEEKRDAYFQSIKFEYSEAQSRSVALSYLKDIQVSAWNECMKNRGLYLILRVSNVTGEAATLNIDWSYPSVPKLRIDKVELFGGESSSLNRLEGRRFGGTDHYVIKRKEAQELRGSISGSLKGGGTFSDEFFVPRIVEGRTKSCEEYVRSLSSDAWVSLACNDQTEEGYYWEKVGYLRNYDIGGITPGQNSQMVPCNESNLRSTAESWWWHTVRTGWQPPMSSYVGRTGTPSSRPCDICGIFQFRCMKQP